jgi:drug/metabolite transporter (DMT)-like permease
VKQHAQVIFYKEERLSLTTDRAMCVAPFLFVLLWSSSFTTTKIGLRHISPLLFVAIRLVACAIVLTVLMLLPRQSWRPLSGWTWLHCAIAGALMNAVGLMAPHVGLLTAPAAQVALVQSLTPLLAAAFGVVLLREGLRDSQWVGLVLGLVGVGLVVGEAALESTVRFQGLVLAFVGVLGLVAGTLYFGRFCRSVPPLAGAVVAALCAWSLETPFAEWTDSAIAAVAWNTFMVSLGGMALYFAMLVRGTVARASANFYLVPGTAAVLAGLFLGERPSLLALAGLITASVGCWLVNAATINCRVTSKAPR